MIKKTLRWILVPSVYANIDPRTYKLLMLDAAGLGIGNSAVPFLTIFIANLHASNFQVSLLSSMPAIAGFFLVLFVGGLIQQHSSFKNLASISSLFNYSAYFILGLFAFFTDDGKTLVTVTLILWALSTIPQTITLVSHQIIIRNAAGESGRFDLTTRRWALIGLVTTIGTAITGEILERSHSLLNYQFVFIVLSFGGFLCFIAIKNMRFEDISIIQTSNQIFQGFSFFFKEIRNHKLFMSFIGKRFVYFLGTTLANPIISLYYIREVGASPRWIGLFSTISMAFIIIGYFFWLRVSTRYRSNKILLITLAIVGVYPFLLALTINQYVIICFLMVVGFFQAGIDLVFFDEIMKVIPVQNSSIFISFNLQLQFLASALGPLLGATLANNFNLRTTLIIGSLIKLFAFLLFAFNNTKFLRIIKRRTKRNAG